MGIHQKRHDAHFKLPLLALWPAAIVGRVEQDPVVSAPTTTFSGREACRIIQDPTDGSVIEAAALRILGCPIERGASRIQVRDLPAVLGGKDARDTGVAEEVQQTQALTPPLFRQTTCKDLPLLGHPAPVRCLFGEDPDVLERGRLDPQA